MSSHETSTAMVLRSRPRYLGLIALNALLLGVLALVSLAPNAGAQAARPRGEYLMVAGRVNGVDGAAVFVIDSSNQEMMAVALNNTSKRLDGIGYRNLAQDARALPGSAQSN